MYSFSIHSHLPARESVEHPFTSHAVHMIRNNILFCENSLYFCALRSPAVIFLCKNGNDCF